MPAPRAILAAILAATATHLVAASDLQPMPQPAGCPLPEPWVFSDFSWYNGSHGVDCTSNHGNQATQGCLCDDGKAWCEPPPAACNGSLVSLCSTGLSSPSVPVPWGFGPWENLNVTLPTGNVCRDMYAGFRTHEIGKGYLCNTIGPPSVGFVGTSEMETSEATFSYGIFNYASLKCDDGKKIAYSGQTTVILECDIDEFRNSTCTTPDFVIPVTGWYYETVG